jgi:toxin ParE1/3/4
MAARLLWSPQARADLLEIYVDLGLVNPGAAEKYCNRIEEKTGRLTDHPRMGARRPDIRASARMLVEDPFLILYETHPDADEGPIDVVEIVRVVHGRRDLGTLSPS